MMFADRVDAGRRLAERVRAEVDARNAVVVGLPRGGVPVAYEVAQALGAPLDVIVVRKLGVPYHRELGYGAVGEDGVRVLNPDIVRLAALDPGQMAEVERRARAEVEGRANRLRGGRPATPFEGRTVIVVDDGVATGGTARAACQVARARGAERVVLAVPVGSPDVIAELSRVADQVVCVETPRDLFAIGAWYEDFSPTSDEEVTELLRGTPAGAGGRGRRP